MGLWERLTSLGKRTSAAAFERDVRKERGRRDPLSFDSLYDSICEKAGYGDELHNLNAGERAFYVVSMFNMEVQNGGLCQFFVNSTRELAPEVAQALRAIGADIYAELYESFCAKNGIDWSDLDSFVIDDVAEFEARRECAPFDDFDDAFYVRYETDSLEDRLERYARAHREQFI